MIGLFFLSAAFIPIPGDDDMTSYYNAHAINLKRKGYIRDAVQFWEKSSRMNESYSVYASLSLARYYLKRGNLGQAFKYVNTIPTSSFAVAQKYQMLGDIYRHQKSYDQSIAAYEKSLSYNSSVIIVYKRLIDLYKAKDREKAIELRKKLRFINSFYK
jgi:tetratricopeptide (TPR) repeat protein